MVDVCMHARSSQRVAEQVQDYCEMIVMYICMYASEIICLWLWENN